MTEKRPEVNGDESVVKIGEISIENESHKVQQNRHIGPVNADLDDIREPAIDVVPQ